LQHSYTCNRYQYNQLLTAMKTILIPVDFSNTAANAIRYAADLSCDAKVERIILLKSYHTSIYAELLPSADLVQLSADDINTERQKIADLLKSLSLEMGSQCKPHIKIESVISELPLLRSIHQLIQDEQPDVLVTGSDAGGKETYIGSHVIDIAKTSPIPVLVVPSHVKYHQIKRAIVPCDLDAISRLDVLKALRISNNWPQPELLVLSVDPDQKHAANQHEHAKAIGKILDGYNYHIHYSNHRKTVEGILHFADANHAQIIIALPGRYSFFYNLTHSSITESLSVNAKRPVLILK
jgi:nucleotide-binding universal stress UspA family protein